MIPLLRKLGEHTCRGCGCSDSHACITEDGPCAWVLLDIDADGHDARTGVCSACAADLAWDPNALALVGIESTPGLLRGVA